MASAVMKVEGKASPNLARTILPRDVRNRIVVLFAQFQGLAAVRDAIKDEFGLDVPKGTLSHYDPSRPGQRLSRKLRDLHASARAAYVGETVSVGISHQSHRLRLIERAIDKATTAKEFNAVARLLELAAREMGGTLTNVSKVEHAGAVEHRHLSVDDARSELAQRLAAALDGGVLTALPSPAKPLDEQG